MPSNEFKKLEQSSKRNALIQKEPEVLGKT